MVVMVASVHIVVKGDGNREFVLNLLQLALFNQQVLLLWHMDKRILQGILPVWFVETKRYMDFTNPGSQAKQGSFFGLDAALEGLEPSPLLNHLGLANDIENAHVWKLKEIKN
ncbi:photosystem I chlorophyll a/b-binding protein 5, chloroplastic, partial [Tanacetum coccineum]